MSSNYERVTIEESKPTSVKDQNSTWTEPAPFSRATPAPLDLAVAIPPTMHELSEFIKAQSVALQVSPDAVALLVMGITSLAASRAFECEPQPGWRETAPLWTVFLAEPGERKSALLAALAEPVHRWQSVEREYLRHALAGYAEFRRVIEARLSGVRAKLARCKPGETRKLEEESVALAHSLENMPELCAPVLVSANVTPEAARDALAANGEKLALISAEVDAGQLMGTRYAKSGGANMDLFLSAWSGDPCPVLRVGRNIPLARPALSMILAVQPAAVREVLRDPAAMGRGMIDRLMFVQPTSSLGFRQMRPPPVPDELASWWHDSISRILSYPWCGRVVINGTGPVRSDAAPKMVGLSEEAASCLLKAREELEAGMRPDAALAPIAGFCSKLPGMIVRIALALHVLENPDSETIELATMKAACAWIPFLIEHTRAVRGEAAESETFRNSRRLLDAIKRSGQTTVTARDCLRLIQCDSVQTAEACSELIGELVERGYLREQQVQATPRPPGRPASKVYDVNPSLLKSD